MIRIFFTANRLLKLAYLPSGQKYRKEYFNNETVKGINQQCDQGAGYRVTNTMKIHMDNCRGDAFAEDLAQRSQGTKVCEACGQDREW
jgi:hypothetical protein